jgi:hypothetical protein
MSGGFSQIDKWSARQSHRRTGAMVSEKVAQSLQYQAAWRTGMVWHVSN